MIDPQPWELAGWLRTLRLPTTTERAMAAERARDVLRILGPVKCLGVTKTGTPRHPLYVRKDADLIAYPPEAVP